MKKLYIFVTFGALFGISGCAGVTFYSDETLTKKTGIPIYSSKPYLLVSRTGSTEKPVEISIVHLSDPEKVIYAEPRSGFGSANLTLTLTNGQLASFGQQTDTRISELITSLGGFLTSRATAAKTAAEARNLGETQQGGQIAVILGKSISGIADTIAKEAPTLRGLSDNENDTIKSAQAAIKAAGDSLANPENLAMAPQNIDAVKKQIEKLNGLTKPTNTVSARNTSLRQIQSWISALENIISAIPSTGLTDTQTDSDSPPSFELYEIIQNPNGPKLRQVTQ